MGRLHMMELDLLFLPDNVATSTINISESGNIIDLQVMVSGN